MPRSVRLCAEQQMADALGNGWGSGLRIRLRHVIGMQRLDRVDNFKHQQWHWL